MGNRDARERVEPVDRPVPWAALAPGHSDARSAWASIDGPAEGRPRAPAQLDLVSEDEEVDAIMSGWE
ncbi:MAG TPA: hypothetical protein VGO20_07785 [Arenibaculum sp.]|nr:hypothetical protein [Arenibaculum sp.]